MGKNIGIGFYVRKSLRAGPFRFNISKSGVGVSAGIPGFRVGTGPRGNYVHVGRHGVYYRTTLGSGPAPAMRPPPAPAAPSADIALEDVTGATAAELVPTGADDLVEQLNEAAGRPALWPLVALAAVVLVALVPPALAVVPLVAGVALGLWVGARDRARRAVVAFYEVEGPQADWLNAVVAIWETLGHAGGLWRVVASGEVATTYQYKTHAGAGSILSRGRLLATLAPPRVLVTNIAVPSLVAGNQALHFLPDRVLVRNGRQFADLSYAALQVRTEAIQFIEDGRVPHDGQQVDTTWQYVNVNGGPDRRFKNNRQLPVMLYGRMLFTSNAGLRWIVDCSRLSLTEQAGSTIRAAEAPQPIAA